MAPVDADGGRGPVGCQPLVVLEMVARGDRPPRHQRGGQVIQDWRMDQQVVHRDDADADEQR